MTKLAGGGVVREPTVHREVLFRVLERDYSSMGFKPCGLCPSPLKGPAGNIEYLVHYRPCNEVSGFKLEDSIEEVLDKVESSWKE